MQENPKVPMCALLGSIFVIRPSSKCAFIPQEASQILQKVVFTSIFLLFMPTSPTIRLLLMAVVIIVFVVVTTLVVVAFYTKHKVLYVLCKVVLMCIVGWFVSLAESVRQYEIGRRFEILWRGLRKRIGLTKQQPC